jgi:hypothetical protein
MKLRIFLAAAIIGAAISCQKGDNNDPGSSQNPPVTQINTVKLTFSGDIATANSPLGRIKTDEQKGAKTFADSTVYAISIHRNGTAVYSGLYSRTDSIMLKIPNSGNIEVRAIAFRKGNGPGIFCYQEGQDFRYPWLGPVYYNRMDTVYGGNLYYNIDSINFVNLFDDAGVNVNPDPTRNSELDTYVGRTSFAALQTPAQITLSMRRIVFGIRYNVSNFNNGRLIADFSNLMPTKYITPADDLSKQYVYTANELQWADSLYLHPVNLSLKWEKPDGSIVLIGQKQIAFQRNVLTNVNITIPNQSTGIPSMPIDTNWQRTDNINF